MKSMKGRSAWERLWVAASLSWLGLIAVTLLLDTAEGSFHPAQRSEWGHALLLWAIPVVASYVLGLAVSRVRRRFRP